MVRAPDSGARGRAFDPHSGHHVVSLSKEHLLPQSTSDTIIMIIIIMSLFNEDNIFSKYTNLTYGPLKSKNTKNQHNY